MHLDVHVLDFLWVGHRLVDCFDFGLCLLLLLLLLSLVVFVLYESR